MLLNLDVTCPSDGLLAASDTRLPDEHAVVSPYSIRTAKKPAAGGDRCSEWLSGVWGKCQLKRALRTCWCSSHVQGMAAAEMGFSPDGFSDKQPPGDNRPRSRASKSRLLHCRPKSSSLCCWGSLYDVPVMMAFYQSHKSCKQSWHGPAQRDCATSGGCSQCGDASCSQQLEPCSTRKTRCCWVVTGFPSRKGPGVCGSRMTMIPSVTQDQTTCPRLWSKSERVAEVVRGRFCAMPEDRIHCCPRPIRLFHS